MLNAALTVALPRSSIREFLIPLFYNRVLCSRLTSLHLLYVHMDPKSVTLSTDDKVVKVGFYTKTFIIKFSFKKNLSTTE